MSYARKITIRVIRRMQDTCAVVRKTVFHSSNERFVRSLRGEVKSRLSLSFILCVSEGHIFKRAAFAGIKPAAISRRLRSKRQVTRETGTKVGSVLCDGTVHFALEIATTLARPAVIHRELCVVVLAPTTRT